MHAIHELRLPSGVAFGRNADKVHFKATFGPCFASSLKNASVIHRMSRTNMNNALSQFLNSSVPRIR